MSYRPTFAVHAIGRDEPKALEIGIEAMGVLTRALAKIDEAHLRRFPTTTPRIYTPGLVRYDPLDPPEGSLCGDDDWQDVASIIDDDAPRGPDGEFLADCEDLSAWRSAEANVILRVGERLGRAVPCECCGGSGWVFPRVEPYVKLHRDWVRDERGDRRRRHLYHVVCRWPEGLSRYPNTVERDDDGVLIEDPSDVLGMND